MTSFLYAVTVREQRKQNYGMTLLRIIPDLTKYISPTYRFHNWLGKIRTIYLTVEKSRLEFEYTVFAHTANLDDGSKPHKMAYSILRPLDDTPLDECWDNCLAKFQELFESK